MGFGRAKRRRVLLIGYYYLPKRMAASYRVAAWAKYLPQFGWEPVVLTRNWRPGGGSPWERSVAPECVERDPHSGCPLYRTGYRQAWKSVWEWRAQLSGDSHPPLWKLSLRKALSYALKNILLYPDEFVGWHRDACSSGRAIIERHEVDAVLATGPPWTDFLVARNLSREHGLRWVADYRDPWTQPTSLGLTGRFAVFYLIGRFIEKSVSKEAKALIHINEPLALGLGSHLGRPVHVIPNGYDPEQFEKHRGSPSTKPPFTISFVGTLHTGTNPHVFLEGFYLFTRRTGASPGACRVRFTGDGFWHLEREYLNFERIRPFVSLEAAVPQEQAVQRMCSAHVLLSFPLDMEGCTPAKTFEYLASARPILVSPDGTHRAAIKEILRQTRAGLVLDQPEDIARWLEDRYEEFVRTGVVRSETDLRRVGAYSRKAQAQKLAEILDDITDASGGKARDDG